MKKNPQKKKKQEDVLQQYETMLHAPHMQPQAITKETYTLFSIETAKQVAEQIHKKKALKASHTHASETVYIISNGSSVTGLGTIGPDAVLPVLEGKARLLRHFGQLHTVPLAVTAQSVEEFAYITRTIAPTCSAVLFDSIDSPLCFDVLKETQQKGYPCVLESNTHGDAVVILAGLINAHIVRRRTMRQSRIAILGTNALTIAVTQLLLEYGVSDITVVDRDGILHPLRTNVDGEKEHLAITTNREQRIGGALEAVTGADVVISVSKSGPLKQEYIRMMAQQPIVFALRDPEPELSPKEAHTVGAAVFASRSEAFPNTVTDTLILPHLVSAVCSKGVAQLSKQSALALARSLASTVSHPTEKKILPTVFDRRISKQIRDTL
jgi:malate dehydrogenase (oxaloacetate-decarboxylating)